MFITVTNSLSLKNTNRKHVFEILHQHACALSQQTIAKKTGLTVASIGNIIADLKRMRLVQVEGNGLSSGGRKPRLLGLDLNFYRIVGISISVERYMILLTNLQGEIIKKVTGSFNLEEEPEHVIEQIIKKIDKLVQEEMIFEKSLLGIGISSPGPIDIINGKILSPPKLPKWRAVPIVEMVKAHWHVPVLIEKDSNAMLLGECRYGHGKSPQVKHALFLMVDAGIGSSLLIDGKVYRGGANFAGEIGYGYHTRKHKDNISGKFLISAITLIEEAQERLKLGEKSILSGKNITIDSFLKACQVKDPFAINLLRQSADDVGQLLADKINFLNPELVIIGGVIPTAVPYYVERVSQVARSHIYKEISTQTAVVPSTFNYEQEAIGATTTVLDQLFTEDIIL